jgi:site-specific recombinase XerD
LAVAQRLRYVAVALTNYGTEHRMTLDEFRDALRAHFSSMLESQKRSIRDGGRLSSLTTYSFESVLQSPYPSSFREKNLLDLTNDMGIDDILKNAGLSTDIPTDIRRAFRAEYRLADRAYTSAVLQFNGSYEAYTFDEQALPLKPDAAPKPADKGVTLSEAVREFKADVKLEKRWTGKTEGERQEHIELLYEVLGADRLVSDIGYNEARNVQQVLRAYPVNRHKMSATRGKTLEEISKMEGLSTIHPRTINKYLQTYKSLFNWAKRTRLCKENPFDGLSLRTARVNETEPRTAFPDDALDNIRGALSASPSSFLDHHRWGALIGLYTGARLNEIAQLHLADVRIVDGILCFDINADGATKKLKNKWSKRVVPVHPRLTELGFYSYLEKIQSDHANTRLFPQLTYTTSDGYGRNLVD